MTATASWLESHDAATVAYVLWIDGLGIGYTTHPDVLGQREAWSAATGGEFGPLLYGGLELTGAIERGITLHKPEIDPPSLKFRIIDATERWSLAGLMFAEARPMGRTRLTATVAADATTMELDDASQISVTPGITRAFVGLETVLVSAVAGNAWTVERGKASIFPRAGGTEWGRRHALSPTSDGVEVTAEPVRFFNRMVGLYVCHLAGGVWSAGFPDTTDNDAELLWAGRIKHWADPVDGAVVLDCAEIQELAQTNVGTRMYEGTLGASPTYFKAATSQIRMVVTKHTGGGNPSQWIEQAEMSALVDQFVTYQDVADAVNDALDAAEPSFPGDTGFVLEFDEVTLPEGSGRYRVVVRLDTVALTWYEVAIGLSAAAWNLLGWRDVSGWPSSWSNDQELFFMRPEREASISGSTYTYHQAYATNAPGRFALSGERSGQRLTVTPATSAEFVQQTYLPADMPDGSAKFYWAVGFPTHGFLGIGDRIFGVSQITADTFLVTAEWLDRASSPGTVNDILNVTIEDIDVRIRQVWVEPYATIGEALLVAMCSTGTEGYSVPLYDRLPSGMGCAIPGSLLDIASFLAMPAIPYLLIVTARQAFTTILEAALTCTGCQLVWLDGKLTIVRPFDDDAEPLQIDDTSRAVALSQGQTSTPLTGERTASERNPGTIINYVTLQHSRKLGVWSKVLDVHAEESQTDYDQAKGLIMPGLGIYEEGADWIIDNVIPPILAYFSEPVAQAERSFNYRLAARFTPGRQLSVDDLTLIDPATGRRGVVGLRAWAIGSVFDLMTGLLRGAFVFQPRSGL